MQKEKEMEELGIEKKMIKMKKEMEMEMEQKRSWR